MTFIERVFHSVLFEVGAVALSVLAVMVAGDTSGTQALLLSLLISLIAVLCNFLFNYLFDKIFTGKREQRTIALRLAHTLCFESLLLIATVPLIAYFLKLSLWFAFLADISLSLLIMLYAFIFNWVFDVLRVKWWAKRGK